MTRAQWIWRKLKDLWRQVRRVAGAETTTEKATRAYMSSREYREVHAL